MLSRSLVERETVCATQTVVWQRSNFAVSSFSKLSRVFSLLIIYKHTQNVFPFLYEMTQGKFASVEMLQSYRNRAFNLSAKDLSQSFSQSSIETSDVLFHKRTRDKKVLFSVSMSWLTLMNVWNIQSPLALFGFARLSVCLFVLFSQT